MGDKFRFKTNTMEENRNKPVKTVELEIVGMFTGENRKAANFKDELYQNIFVTDLDSTRKLNSYPADGSKDIYNDASFFTHSAFQLNDFIKETKKKDINWRKYELLKNGSYFMVVGETINGIYKITRVILITSIIMTMVLLTLILFMWIKERRKEVAILLSIGNSKTKILLQHIVELLVIFAGSLASALALSKVIVQNIGNHIPARSQSSSIKDVTSQLNLGSDADSSAITRTINNVAVNIQGQDIAKVIMIVGIIIVISVIIISLPMLKEKPKKLLAKID